jgi:acetoin:2,6-dichlorophenolindophenol oxidoreductase subunit alpha
MTTISRQTIMSWGHYDKLTLAHTEPQIALHMHRFMSTLRKFQEEIIREYHPANEMKCPVHFVIGQEGVPAALSTVIGKDDYLFGPHRSHGYFLAKGGSMNSLLAELYGKKTGVNGGKAGSQEIACEAIHFHSGAILSGTLAIAVGAALAFQLKKTSQLAVACFGDGAIDEGIFWEAVNYAQLCRLPMVFICENNGFSTYSPQLKRQVADNIHERVASFGMHTRAIFGNDTVAVRDTLQEAFSLARSGEGPAFIEAYTSRWKGHVGPEDDDYVGYRTPEELEFWKNNCPIRLLEEKLVENSLLNKQSLEQMNKEIGHEVASAFAFAKSSPFPDDTNWAEQNYCSETPVADRLLKDSTNKWQFDFTQAQTTPEPY